MAEGGFAMVATMLGAVIMTLLTVTMLSTGSHSERATVRDRGYNEALQAAESGLNVALQEISKGVPYAGTGGTPRSVPGGQYEVAVSVPQPGYLVVESIGYRPSKGHPQEQVRRVKATYGPEAAFKFALFSDTGLAVKNNDGTVGDIFANESIVMEQNSGVRGSVISATGSVLMENNAKVRKNGTTGGDVSTGGYDPVDSWALKMLNGADVEGSAYAEAETCPGSAADSLLYNIQNSGTIDGAALARGQISGSVAGTRSPYTCQRRHERKVLPTFNFDASLYTPLQQYTTVATFQTWLNANKTAVSGTHRVWVDACGTAPSAVSSVLDMGGVVINNDFTLITNCRIDFNNNTTFVGDDEARVELIVLNESVDPVPAINIKNNFEIPDPSPAVLLYSTGEILVKNNAESNGAVYGGAISIKNNLDVTYDPRVERTLGFGEAKYERISWQECRSGALSSTC